MAHLMHTFPPEGNNMKTLITVLCVCVALALGACRVGVEQLDGGPDAGDGDVEVVCEPHQVMCVAGDVEWCCTAWCDPGCTGGGCSDSPPYCTGCYCP